MKFFRSTTLPINYPVPDASAAGKPTIVTPESEISKPYSERKYLWLATNAHFATDFYNGFLSPLLPLIVTRLDLSLTLAGLLLSIFSIANSLVQPIAGLISDRLRRHYFVLFGPLITAVFMGFIGWVNQYWTLLIILIMSGIGTAMFHPPGAAMVGRLNHQSKGISMSLFNMSGALGSALGSLLIVPLIQIFGLKATVFTIVPGLLFFFYSYRVISKAERLQTSASRPRHLLQTVQSHRWTVLSLYLLVVIRATTVVSFTGFVPLFLASRGQKAVLGGVALAIFQLFTTAGIFIGGHIYDRIGTRKTLFLSYIFVAPFALAFLNLPVLWGLPFLALLGFFLQSSTSVNIILGQALAPAYASFMSSIMMGLGWGVAGLLMTPIGALADRIGLYWTMTGISFMSLAGLVLVYFLPKQLRAG